METSLERETKLKNIVEQIAKELEDSLKLIKSNEANKTSNSEIIYSFFISKLAILQSEISDIKKVIISSH